MRIVMQGLGEINVDGGTLLCLAPFAVVATLVLLIGLVVQAVQGYKERANRIRLQEMMTQVIIQEIEYRDRSSCLVTVLLLLLGLLAIPLLRGVLR